MNKITKIILVLVILVILVTIGLVLCLGLGLKSNSNGGNANQINSNIPNQTAQIWDSNLCNGYLEKCKDNINKGLVPASALNGCYEILDAHKCDMTNMK
jgi:hypothetical protein